MSQTPEQLTQLLDAWGSGDPDALNQLIPLIYDELHKLAHRYVRRQPNEQTLQTTGLVHEVYLRLAGRDSVSWQNRVHFFAVCSQVMRNLLIDRARARQSMKRGGNIVEVEADEAGAPSPDHDEELLTLHAALERLAEIDPRKSRIVEMRYFGGMSTEETASALGLSEITIKREWLKARAWLYREIVQPS